MALPPDSPYASALDNWERFTAPGDEPMPAQIPEPEPHLLLAGEVPEPEPAAPVDNDALRNRVQSSLKGIFGPQLPVAQGMGMTVTPTGQDYLTASGMSGELTPGQAEAAYKGHPIYGPKATELAAEGRIAAERQTGAGSDRFKEVLSGERPLGPGAAAEGKKGEGDKGDIHPKSSLTPIGPSGAQAMREGIRASAAEGSSAVTFPSPALPGKSQYPEWDMERFDKPIREAGGRVATAEQEIAKITAAGEASKQLVYANLEPAIQGVHDDAAIRQSRIQDHINDARTRHDTAVKELDETNIDTGRVLRNPFMALIALAGGVVGGAYGAMTGTHKNQFLETLDGVVQRDIAGQKANLDKKRQVIGEYRNQLDFLRQSLGDDRLAENALTEHLYKKAANSIQEAAARNGGPLAIANGKKTVEAIGLKLAENAKQGEQDRLTYGVNKENAAATLRLSEAEILNRFALGKYTADSAGAAARAASGPAAAKPGEVQALQHGVIPWEGAPGGTIQVVASDPEIVDLRKANRAATQAKGVIGDLKNLIAGETTPGTAGLAKAATLQKLLMNHLRLMYSAGALDKGAQEVFDEVIGSPGIVGETWGQMAAKLEALETYLDNSRQTMLDGFAWHPAQAGVDYTSTGHQYISYEGGAAEGHGTPGKSTPVGPAQEAANNKRENPAKPK